LIRDPFVLVEEFCQLLNQLGGTEELNVVFLVNKSVLWSPSKSLISALSSVDCWLRGCGEEFVFIQSQQKVVDHVSLGSWGSFAPWETFDLSFQEFEEDFRDLRK
jgi:hypothetical protein